MPETACRVDSTTQPPSRAAAQIVAMPHAGPHVAGTADSPPATAAHGQSGRRSNRRPLPAAATRPRQNSETIVTIVQPTCSGRADDRCTNASAADRRPADVRTAGGMPSDRHEATRSEAIARRRSRRARDGGQALGGATGAARPFASTTATDSRTMAAPGCISAAIVWPLVRKGKPYFRLSANRRARTITPRKMPAAGRRHAAGRPGTAPPAARGLRRRRRRQAAPRRRATR